VSGRNPPSILPVLFAVVFVLIVAKPAHAYLGPGAGLDQVVYAMSLFAAAGVAFSAVLLWPFYALLRLLRRKPATTVNPAATTPSQNPVGAGTAADSATVPTGEGQTHS
jgi:hypothetical protein